MRSRIKAGDLEIGAIVWRNCIPGRVTDIQRVSVAPYWVCLGVTWLFDNGEFEGSFRVHREAEIEGHNRTDRLQLGRRYRLRDRVTFDEAIADCTSHHGGGLRWVGNGMAFFSAENIEIIEDLGESTNID